MSQTYDVIIAGAGPIGLLLACELGLGGATVLVLERDTKLESPWKVEPLGYRGLNTLSIEAFYRRGLLSKFFDPSERPSVLEKKPKFQFAGHFAGISLDANKLELSRWKYRLPGPSLVPGPTTIQRVETTLNERAESLGVTIFRGHGVTKIVAHDNNGVTVEAGEKGSFRGRWLVGCDGGRSVVRRAAGFDFVGTEARFTGYVVKCDLDDADNLKMGFNITRTGMYIRGFPQTIHLVDFDGGAFDRTQEITKEHIQDVVRRVTGDSDVKVTAIHLAASFTDRSKQAATYRKDRILLAGDAAHIHSPLGAQGLNLGLGDAMNLGWKLAATVRRESRSDTVPVDLALLDTYESERHPIAAWVLEWTRAQVATLQPDLFGAALQTLIRDFMDTNDGTNLCIDRVWGLSQRYNLGDGEAHAHPLIGCSAPDFEFLDGLRLGSKLEDGRGLLVDFEDGAALRKLAGGEKDEYRVNYVGMGAKNRCGLGAIFVRPDGVVAWVTEESTQPDLEAARAALAQWVGL
ncbi:putative Pentachlorophenol 4-monooxygenase [Pleurostoma richardsiae]|uniref:Pentachlorophenol 4-monooxygenase n=1 Tax=Pleurostoma richardsiae TaxID=41990 RepID=A0AA38S0V5_9PEZI|nr:putative Pentachlorophenol 4-monooxygenase [Pleurostoma richardsiae]